MECHIYGQLIRILIYSSSMFRMREILLRKRKKEMSEYKALYLIQDYLLLVYQAIQQDVQQLTSILLRLYKLLEKTGENPSMRRKLFLILWVLYTSEEGK